MSSVEELCKFPVEVKSVTQKFGIIRYELYKCTKFRSTFIKLGTGIAQSV